MAEGESLVMVGGFGLGCSRALAGPLVSRSLTCNQNQNNTDTESHYFSREGARGGEGEG